MPLLATLALPVLSWQTIILRNGDMEAGTAVPANWEAKWVGRGTVEIARDATEKHGGAASLRVEAKGPDSQGAASQLIEAKAGETVTVSGWIKTAGKVKAIVGFQPFSADWKQNEFKLLGYAQNDTGWTRFSASATVPAWGARFNLALLVEGDGKAWLDDVELTGANIGKEDTRIPPDAQEPTVPYRGYWPAYPQAWDQTFAWMKSEAAKGNVDVVFLGDSITQGWREDSGKGVFAREFGAMRTINLGIGGDRTNQLLYRIDHGQFDGLDPKLVVLNIGVNNFWAGDFSPEKIADGVGAVIARIQKRLPKAKILNVGILPTQEDPKNGLRTKANSVNALLAKRADGGRVAFVDLGSAFLEADGRLPKRLMPDSLHPNAEGYEA